MTINKKRTILALISVIAASAVGVYVLVQNNSPKLKYEIAKMQVEQDVEAPLQIEKQDKYVNFSISFKEKEGKVERAKLNNSVKFQAKVPFIQFNNELVIYVSGIKEEIDPETTPDMVYKITGKIVNLNEQSYKLKIYDEYNNLIDEAWFDLSE